MNYLQLCERLRSEAGLSGTVTAVTGQTGDFLRIVNWVKQAWLDIQDERHDWRWMRTEKSFNTSAAKSDYTTTDLSITDMGRWKPETCRIYKTADGEATETFLTPIEYEDWIKTYGAGTITDSAPQYVIVIQPDNTLRLTPGPDAQYTVTIEYSKAPTELSATTDTPDMPSHLHMLIVYEAMKMYAAWDNAPEKYSYAAEQAAKLRNRLDADQRPRIIVNSSPVLW